MVQWKMAVFVGRYLLLDIPTSFSLNHDRGREGNDPWKHIPEQTNQQMSHEKKRPYFPLNPGCLMTRSISSFLKKITNKQKWRLGRFLADNSSPKKHRKKKQKQNTIGPSAPWQVNSVCSSASPIVQWDPPGRLLRLSSKKAKSMGEKSATKSTNEVHL